MYSQLCVHSDLLVVKGLIFKLLANTEDWLLDNHIYIYIIHIIYIYIWPYKIALPTAAKRHNNLLAPEYLSNSQTEEIRETKLVIHLHLVILSPERTYICSHAHSNIYYLWSSSPASLSQIEYSLHFLS